MPAINLQLTAQGPLLQVLVNVSAFRADALTKAGQAVPQWVPGTFLLDTGASGTCVDPDILNPLRIPPSGSVSVQTPSTGATPHVCNQYDIQLYIPGQDPGQEGLLIAALPVLESVLAPQGIDGLLGRDVLERCTLIYNPAIRIFTLAY